MISKSYIFKKVTIIGVGLMGGSLGKAIKVHKLAKEVVGVSHRQSSLVHAVKNEVIDTALTDIPKGVKNADLVVLATPVESIIKLLTTIRPHLKRGCIVTDVGSAKVEIVEAAQKAFSNSGMFVGSHPLVGSEKKGVSNSRSDLFEGSVCIMTPIDNTNRMAKEKVKQLWTRIGSNVKIISPEEHDETLAYISHLPHLMAFGLMETIPQKYLDLAPQGLKDTTRIAASTPEMWSDIFLTNSINVIKSLDEYVKNLSHLRKAIVSRDAKALLNHFSKAKEKRDQIQSKKQS